MQTAIIIYQRKDNTVREERDTLEKYNRDRLKTSTDTLVS